MPKYIFDDGITFLLNKYSPRDLIDNTKDMALSIYALEKLLQILKKVLPETYQSFEDEFLNNNEKKQLLYYALFFSYYINAEKVVEENLLNTRFLNLLNFEINWIDYENTSKLINTTLFKMEMSEFGFTKENIELIAESLQILDPKQSFLSLLLQDTYSICPEAKLAWESKWDFLKFLKLPAETGEYSADRNSDGEIVEDTLGNDQIAQIETTNLLNNYDALCKWTNNSEINSTENSYTSYITFFTMFDKSSQSPNTATDEKPSIQNLKR